MKDDVIQWMTQAYFEKKFQVPPKEPNTRPSDYYLGYSATRVEL